MKFCNECGCNMPDNHDGDICEVCKDERGDTVADGLRKDVEPLYPNLVVEFTDEDRKRFCEILKSRLDALKSIKKSRN